MQNHTNIPTVIFPAIFFDGEREIDLGNVEITSLMSYKSFSKLIADIIGISPHQITIYLEHHHTQNYHLTLTHRRHRQPVTSKFDFASLVVARSSGAATECYFSAVLKRRTRRARHHRSSLQNRRNMNMNEENKVVLLRREMNMNMEDMVYMDMVMREKDRYLMSLNLNSNVYDELSGINFYNNLNQIDYDYSYNLNQHSMSGSDDVDIDGVSCSTTGSDRVFCDVCCNFSSDDTVPFHWCKNDVVTNGFRSSVGPIAPPAKD